MDWNDNFFLDVIVQFLLSLRDLQQIFATPHSAHQVDGILMNFVILLH